VRPTNITMSWPHLAGFDVIAQLTATEDLDSALILVEPALVLVEYSLVLSEPAPPAGTDVEVDAAAAPAVAAVVAADVDVSDVLERVLATVVAVAIAMAVVVAISVDAGGVVVVSVVDVKVVPSTASVDAATEVETISGQVVCLAPPKPPPLPP